MINSKKGQGALEYLLLIGGAVIIAVIVVALLVGMNQSSKQGVHDNATTTTKIIENSPFAPVLDSVKCINPNTNYINLNYNLFENKQPIGSKAYVVVDGELALSDFGDRIVPELSPTDTHIKLICNGTPHSIQIRIETVNGNFIDSNPLLINS